MKSILVVLTGDEFRALLDYFAKLQKLGLPEEAVLVIDEIRKVLF